MTLASGDQRRLMVLNQVGSGLLSSQQAAGLLGISKRHLRRLRRAYEARGAQAVAHCTEGASVGRPAGSVPNEGVPHAFSGRPGHHSRQQRLLMHRVVGQGAPTAVGR